MDYTTPDTISSLGSVPAEGWSDFLTPEQRLAAVAEIMADAALAVLHKRQTEAESDSRTQA